ncbi:MAG: TonB-dependent receptor [Bacteroidetes bacterium]|nr:TonB-dependent receptor [Bacteroidota bacterium]
MELSNSLDHKEWSITTSIFYRKTDDMISRFRTVDPNTGIGVMTTTNFASSENLGGELIVGYTFDKIGSIMGSFNIYRNKINGSNIQSDFQTNATQWSSRLNASLRVAKNTFFR